MFTCRYLCFVITAIAQFITAVLMSYDLGRSAPLTVGVKRLDSLQTMQPTSVYRFAQVRGEPYMCSPHLWEGKKWTLQITHTDQGPDVWESTSEFSVDIIGQRFASRETGVRFGQPYDIFYLYYYPANTLFRVQDGKCRSSAIEGAIKQNCLNMPDQYAVENLNEFLATYVNGTYCGGVRGVRDGVGYFHSVTPNGFNSPVMEQTQGDVDSVPTYRVSNYYNVTSGIKDPTVFTPPLSCIQTQDLATEDFGIHRPESLFL